MKSQIKPLYSLLQDRAFWPLLIVQFLGAFNDNFFKNALVILMAFQSLTLNGLSPEKLIALASGIFIFPFFLFSAVAGQIADKYEKSCLIVSVQGLEIFIMTIAVFGFMTKNLMVLLTALFFMGLQSALFGPLKYAYAPQILSEKSLVPANAFLQSSTFLAILSGTLLGGMMVAVPERGIQYICVGIIALAVLGFLFSLWILKASPSEPNLRFQYNPFTSTKRLLAYVWQKPPICFAVLCLSWFWFYGATMLALLPTYGKKVLGGNESVVVFLLTLFSIGIGLGCLTCAVYAQRTKYSENLGKTANKYKRALTPALLGALGLSLFLLDLFWQSLDKVAHTSTGLSWAEFIQNPRHFRVIFDLTMIAFSGGLFFVPLMTFLQKSAPKPYMSRVIAGNNILSALFMALSAVLLMIAYSLGLNEIQIFLCLSLLNLIVFLMMALKSSVLRDFLAYKRNRTTGSMGAKE